MIEINHITKDYGNHRGVFDLSFSVKKGEIVGFLGPNGAGKTTTIRQLMGFIKPDTGSLFIGNHSCFEERHLIAENLGYLPGEIAFMDGMTGTEFIQFIGRMKGMKDFHRGEELIQRLDLQCDGKIKKMSKGMKQKIGIVCAFMNNPEVLILDEPTSGLDPLMQNIFVELIQEEKKKGTTILMSSHMFEEVEKTCDRAVIIRDGSIVSMGQMEELKKNKKKQMEITFANEKMTLEFAEIYKRSMGETSLKNLKSEGKRVQLVVGQDMDQVMKMASQYEIIDLDTHTQNLEEFFLHFYGGKEHD